MWEWFITEIKYTAYSIRPTVDLKPLRILKPKLEKNDYVIHPFNLPNFRRNQSKVVCFAYHRLRGSGSTVVMMTSKVNGKMEILTPCRSETPENIETKIGKNDCIMGSFNSAFFRNQSKVVYSPNSWNITLNCVISSLPFFLVVAYSNKKAVLSQGNRAMPQLLFLV